MNKNKFTLIELLVVIATIGILTTILIPGLINARAAAKMQICMTNQNQITRAGYIYSTHNNNYLVADHITNGDNNLFFAARYLPYLSNFENKDIIDKDILKPIFAQVDSYQCPSLTNDEIKLDYTVNSMNLADNSGKGIPNNVSKGNTSQAHKIPRIPLLSETGYLMEVNEFRGKTKENDYDEWDVWHESKATFGADRLANGKGNLGTRMMHYTDQKHLGKMSIAFLDGHSEVRRLNQSGVPFTLFLPLF
ncbi:MAG: type II secretion system GspH family protein [Lentisphaerales bacterium]|nr:type II secretion system GspH family protein [Lentisphaerales bacterium]